MTSLMSQYVAGLFEEASDGTDEKVAATTTEAPGYQTPTESSTPANSDRGEDTDADAAGTPALSHSNRSSKSSSSPTSGTTSTTRSNSKKSSSTATSRRHRSGDRHRSRSKSKKDLEKEQGGERERGGEDLTTKGEKHGHRSQSSASKPSSRRKSQSSSRRTSRSSERVQRPSSMRSMQSSAASSHVTSPHLSSSRKSRSSSRTRKSRSSRKLKSGITNSNNDGLDVDENMHYDDDVEDRIPERPKSTGSLYIHHSRTSPKSVAAKLGSDRVRGRNHNGDVRRKSDTKVDETIAMQDLLENLPLESPTAGNDDAKYRKIKTAISEDSKSQDETLLSMLSKSFSSIPSAQGMASFLTRPFSKRASSNEGPNKGANTAGKVDNSKKNKKKGRDTGIAVESEDDYTAPKRPNSFSIVSRRIRKPVTSSPRKSSRNAHNTTKTTEPPNTCPVPRKESVSVPSPRDKGPQTLSETHKLRYSTQQPTRSNSTDTPSLPPAPLIANGHEEVPSTSSPHQLDLGGRRHKTRYPRANSAPTNRPPVLQNTRESGLVIPSYLSSRAIGSTKPTMEEETTGATEKPSTGNTKRERPRRSSTRVTSTSNSHSNDADKASVAKPNSFKRRESSKVSNGERT